MRTTPKQKRGNPNWVKGGKSPNPGGRPKSANYAGAARKWLDENADALVQIHGAAALGKKPDLSAARMLVEYAEGKPKQSIDLTVDDRKREWAESQLTRVMDAKRLEREDAVRWMRENTPTAAQWIN
jgi:hypothetical protein